MAMFRLSTELTLYVTGSGRVSVYDSEGLAGMMHPAQAYELARAIMDEIKKARLVWEKAQQAQELGK